MIAVQSPPSLVAPNAGKILDTSRPSGDRPIQTTLNQITAATGLSPIRIARDYASLALGRGRVSFADYLKLRLFDPAFYNGSRRSDVVGRRRNVSLVAKANYRVDWMGLFANKIALASYLAAFGFRTPPILTIYSERSFAQSPRVLREPAALRAFLQDPANYPIFGKPAEGFQSLGSMSLKDCRPDAGVIETFDGRELAIDHVVAEVARHYGGDGYVFQRHLMPHLAIRAMCGARLATLRIVTMIVDGTPRIFRACWKIPAGSNHADNYWRPGNLLAQIDLATWRVVRVMSGTGLDLTFHTTHPDTRAALIDALVPDCGPVVDLVLEGARLMREMPLIGWDVAVLEDGPMIIEANEKPDFFLNQLADGRGVLDADFTAFLAEQKAKAGSRAKEIKREAGDL